MRGSKAYKSFIKKIKSAGFFLTNETELIADINYWMITVIDDFLLRAEGYGLTEDFITQCDENRIRHDLWLFDMRERDVYIGDIGLGCHGDYDVRVIEKSFHQELESFLIKRTFKDAVYFHCINKDDPADSRMEASYAKGEPLFSGDADDLSDLLLQVKPHLEIPENTFLPPATLLTPQEINRIQTLQRSTKIRERNDRLRKRVGANIRGMKDFSVFTQMVQNLDEGKKEELIKKVTEFSEFTEDNDPYGEHDYGEVSLEKDPYHPYAFKIDYYDLKLEGGADPYESDEYRAVLTLMNLSEY